MNNAGLKLGTLTGLCLSMFVQFSLQGFLETVLLAATGAVVSYLVGKFLHWQEKCKKK